MEKYGKKDGSWWIPGNPAETEIAVHWRVLMPFCPFSPLETLPHVTFSH